MITIALPNYASNIAWLAMESLCRQITDSDWELIVFEDSDKPLGEDFYRSYTDRLGEAGCIQIMYIYSEPRYALNQKWIKMAELSDANSYGILLQATDCYSEPHRIQTAFEAFALGADWIHSPIGNFYNIRTDKMMLFKMSGKTGLNMAISKRACLAMPRDFEKWSGVDSWLFDNIPDGSKVHCDESTNWSLGVDTDGFNRISIARRGYYTNPEPPFYKSGVELSSLIPHEVVTMLKKFK